ncbi:a356e798-efae-405f-97eb-44d48a4f8a85 [Thermothielavioides terrestris]|uniref:A356e798-efae-405f-97eb-44d48a4f8a85 n=1 Tax=Thermothielavioides terrestris TaxID=2587410 RepID=A0A446BGX6_9PEZI|nr:a356e798-efae-405f-97eb-44d48a4f8a85 [Thermothielavioides terrestris]
MDLDQETDPALPTKTKPAPPSTSTSKTRTLTTATLKNPPFAYAHLSLASPPPALSNPATTTTTTTTPPLLDALQVRAYLTAALRQFLGATGAGMAIDILLVRGGSAWVRVPREDLPAFAAGVTAFGGLPSSSASAGSGAGAGAGAGTGTMLLQLRACGDWLGSLIGRDEEAALWTC